MTSAPCNECEDRCVGCHASCERYNAWTKTLEAAKKKKADVYRSDAAVLEGRKRRYSRRGGRIC